MNYSKAHFALPVILKYTVLSFVEVLCVHKLLFAQFKSAQCRKLTRWHQYQTNLVLKTVLYQIFSCKWQLQLDRSNNDRSRLWFFFSCLFTHDQTVRLTESPKKKSSFLNLSNSLAKLSIELSFRTIMFVLTRVQDKEKLLWAQW